ncbi:MAG: ATP-binding cassette domain-containing protein [Phycisphaerales bacterium]
MSSAISIQNVTKRFGATVAVRGLDLEVPQGSLCGFLGPNGAGKSTTIRMIMSIIYPDEGRISVLGGTALEAKDRIGYLPEERGIYRKMRVGDFLAYMVKLKGGPVAAASRRELPRLVESWLERVELPGVARRKCGELSKGMQQKVQFIAALIHEPELLILDEPFSGLDPVNAEVMRRLVDDLHAQGRTIIFSTHALPQAERLCDRIFLIDRGVKLLDATLDEIRRTYEPRTVVVDPLDPPHAAERGDAADVSAASLSARLAALPSVTDVRLLHDGRRELLLDESADPHAVMRAALDAAPCRGVSIGRVSLEEVFVRLVRQGEGTAGAERARAAFAGGSPANSSSGAGAASFVGASSDA